MIIMLYNNNAYNVANIKYLKYLAATIIIFVASKNKKL